MVVVLFILDINILGSRALVNGGAGFISSHLYDVLLAENNTVICVDNIPMEKPDGKVMCRDFSTVWIKFMPLDGGQDTNQMKR